MEDLLDGVEGELRPSVPVKTMDALNEFRMRLRETRLTRRKDFERELEAFLQSEPFLRTASERYLRKKITPVSKTAIAALKRAESFLAKARINKRA